MGCLSNFTLLVLPERFHYLSFLFEGFFVWVVVFREKEMLEEEGFNS